jgi:NAD(P)H-quinone oxidoreductase subunit 5
MSISSLLVASLLAAIPLTLFIAAVPAGLQSRRIALSDDHRWQFAWRAAQIITLLTLGLIGLSLWAPLDAQAFFSADPLRLILLALLSVMALVVIKFSRRYLAADPGFGRYLRWLLATLAAVALVFISDHLLLFAAGWIAISLSLHQLLMFFPERPRAVLAAHKKFLLARIAEASLLSAFYLLWQHHGTANIGDIVAAYQVPVALSWQEQTAAVLIALTALIKCAQLPVHGWLIQVVEAPTPVSALLHAGVINLGGFLLILFAPLFLHVAAAQWLVLVVAGFTTVFAALIMTTRISIKVRLAWSTSAQMGLMLMECALGLVELALLHLLAHSAYKAHAFLTTGSEVQQHIRQSLVSIPQPNGRQFWLASMPAIIITGCAWLASVWWASAHVRDTSQPFSAWLLLALALTAFIALRGPAVSWLSGIVIAAGIAATYTILKIVLHPVAGTLNPALTPDMFSAPDLWAVAMFALLFSLWWLLRWRSQWRWVKRLSVALFAGLYLDEWFTRTTLRLRPARLPRRANPKQSLLAVSHEEQVL